MLRLLALCVVIVSTLAKPAENGTELTDKANRAIVPSCYDPAVPSVNPCLNNRLGRVNFPHPTDNGKFLQCGMFGRMYIVQCPTGELFDQASSSCVRQTVITTQPVVSVVSAGIPNPCTAQNINAGRLFFGLSNDNTKFISCDQSGNARLLTCPAQMVWDQNRVACTFNVRPGVVLQPGTVGTGVGTLTGAISTTNPCTAQALATQNLFFSHPDPTKFIQCDLQGNAFLQQCPSGLVWNQYLETCANQSGVLQTGIVQAGGIIQVTG